MNSVRDTVRTFNKYLLNPAMLHLAGRRHWYAAVIRHTGRKSGKSYATPVVADGSPVTASFCRSRTARVSTGCATCLPPDERPSRSAVRHTTLPSRRSSTPQRRAPSCLPGVDAPFSGSASAISSKWSWRNNSRLKRTGSTEPVAAQED